MLKPSEGEILFEGQDIVKVPGHKIVSMGMAHVPEGRRVFAELSVYENLKLGAYTRKDKNEIAESLAKVYKSFPRLEERKNQLAGTLSGGEQQMLAMGRCASSIVVSPAATCTAFSSVPVDSIAPVRVASTVRVFTAAYSLGALL